MKERTGKYFFILLLLPFAVLSQFRKVEFGVDGLTCSACSRAVELSIRKLSFVDSVIMNLEHTNGEIFFKKEEDVSIRKIADAITDAGFSVRYITVFFNFSNLSVSDNFCWNYKNQEYLFIKTGSRILNGEFQLKVIGRKYLTKTEMKKWSTTLKNAKGCNQKNAYYISL